MKWGTPQINYKEKEKKKWLKKNQYLKKHYWI